MIDEGFRRFVKWMVGVPLVLFVGMASIMMGLWKIPFRLLIGWAPYLADVIPQTQVNVELWLCSLGALALGIIGLQWLMSRLRTAQPWPWRWTLAWCAMLIVLFSTSIAAVGIVHQTGWLFRLDRWLLMRDGVTEMITFTNAAKVLTATKQYASAHDGKLPEVCADLMPEIVTDSRIFWASMDRNIPSEPFIYAGAGLCDTDSGDLLVLWSPRPSADGWRAIARLDGRIEFVREEKFQKLLAQLRQTLSSREADTKLPR